MDVWDYGAAGAQSMGFVFSLSVGPVGDLFDVRYFPFNS